MLAWACLTWHLPNQDVPGKSFVASRYTNHWLSSLHLNFCGEVIQNSYKWASAGEMKAFFCLFLQRQSCKCRQFLKASEHWIDRKEKRCTQHLIFFRWRSALHRHHATYRCIVSSGSPTHLTVAWLSCRKEIYILLWCSTLQRSISPESWLEISSSGTMQTVRTIICTKNCQAVKFCKHHWTLSSNK